MNSASQTQVLTPTGGMKPLRAAVICLLIAGVMSVLPSVGDVGLYAIVAAMLACLVLPGWYEWYRGRFDPFAPIHVFGLVYFVTFGLGAIWTMQDPVNVAYDRYLVAYITRSAFYCLLGYVALLAGYYSLRSRRGTRLVDTVEVHGVMFLTLVGGVGVVGVLAGAIWQRAARSGGVPGFVASLAQFAPLFVFSWSLGWMLFFSGKSSRAQRAVLFGMLAPGAVLVSYLTLSNKTQITVLTGIPLIAMWYAKRKLPWARLMAMLLILVFVIFPFYNTYRITSRHMAQTDRIGQTYRMINSWDMENFMARSWGAFKQRLAIINSVAVVVRDCPRWVPYAKGETIVYPAFAFFIPRILWPDKPTLTLGREFGRTFRVVPARDKTTYIAVSVPGELYWNFDVLGVVVGMALIGTLMRLLYRRFGRFEAYDFVRLAGHIAIVVEYAQWGAGLAAGVVGLLRLVLILEAFIWLGLHYGMLERVAGPVASVAGGPRGER